MRQLEGIVKAITKPDNPKRAIMLNGAWIPRDQKASLTLPFKGQEIVLELNDAGFYTTWSLKATPRGQMSSSLDQHPASLSHPFEKKNAEIRRMNALTNAIALIELNVKKGAIEASSVTTLTIIGVARELEKYIEGGS